MAEVTTFSKKWTREEKRRDGDIGPCGVRIPTNDLSYSPYDLSNFISKTEFEQYYEEIWKLFLILSEENKTIRKKNSYLESLVMKYFIEDVKKTSHENAIKLREFLHLSPISEKIDESIINELDGILEDIVDPGKSSIELLKEVRGD